MTSPRDQFHVSPRYQPWMRQIGLDAEAVFTHPDVVPWRTLPDRENCTLDAEVDEQPVRLHVKRYPAAARGAPAEAEVEGIRLLESAGIPTLALVGWGQLADGRSFTITEDLAGYRDAEKLVRDGLPFGTLLISTADLAAKLHEAGLHHRDLYLCHFFARVRGGRTSEVDLRLIDAARVARLRNPLTRQRWIVKDLAQFWYSTLALPVADQERDQWLSRYAGQRGICWLSRLRRLIERKARSIARHDRKLQEQQPTRNISIPSSPPKG